MNAIMKLTTTLPAVALMAACSTTTPTAPTTPATPIAQGMSDMAYDRMAPVPYTCADDSTILAKQSINKKQATINATLPKLNVSQQSIILTGDVTNNVASYVNDSNSEIIYAWHMQGNNGILAIKWADGTTYQVKCKI